MGNKGLDFKHKEVINIKDGKRLGFVQDVCADLESGMITSIIVPGNNKILNMFSGSNEIVRKQIPSFLLPTSFVQLEIFNKNSFEVFFVKKNLLHLFLNTSRIIFPFHYFW